MICFNVFIRSRRGKEAVALDCVMRIVPRTVIVSVAAASYLCVCGGFQVAHAEDPVQAQLRMLTHNIYGLDTDYCEQRALAAGHIIANADPPFDIVGLQEYYHNIIEVCGSTYFSEAIWCTGRYTSPNQYDRFNPDGGIFDGGIAIFTMGQIQEIYNWPWSYQVAPEAFQGVILARVQIPGTPVTVDVYLLHLHAGVDQCDRCCRKQELEELRDIIAQNSPCSGNPVIVMGDFNIGGPPTCCGNQGYDDILTALGYPRDLWWEAHPCGQPPIVECGNPATPCDQFESTCFPPICVNPPAPVPGVDFCLSADPFQCNQAFCTWGPAGPACPGWAGYTNDGCVNELTDGEDRIDFIFVVTDTALTSSPYTINLVDARVADWTTVIEPESGAPFISHVSDHLGVEAIIDIVGLAAVWVDHTNPVQGNGTPCNPYKTVAAGVTGVPIGNAVLIRQGTYPENLTITNAMSLKAVNGIVQIGS